MCGITGILHTDTELRKQFTRTGLALQTHRGPDHKDHWTDEEIVTLGHNRLSIIDLSNAGNQPMTSNCGRYTMVYNGEVYNHAALRKKYFQDFKFKSNSDTETIIELFAKKATDTFSELIGMWSLLVWDNINKTLTISRDRFGQKPLYYTKLDHGWAFSSEIKPLLNIRDITHPNATMSTEYLATGNYQHLGKQTFYDEIQQLLPSQYCTLDINSASIDANNYWALPLLSESTGCIADATYLKELKEIIETAVISQTMADVPIGITLSGGIDSSVIAGILAKYYDQPIHVFTAQTPGSKWDESQYVHAVLDKINSPNFKLHSIDLNELMSLEDLDSLLNIQEEPFGDPSIMAHHQLMQLASDNKIKVVLGGQGADEIFWGYSHSVNAILAHCFRKGKFKTILTWLKQGNLSVSLWLRIMLTGFFPRLEAFMRHRSRNHRRVNVPEGIKASAENLKSNKLTNINQSWRDSILGVHIPHLVHYDDRNGMSVGVEGRMPFFDHRIIEKLGELKPSEFVKGGKRKNILRLACVEYLPTQVLNRSDKLGFFTPLHDFIHKNLSHIDNNIVTFFDSSTYAIPEMLLNDLQLYKNKKVNNESSRRIWRFLSYAKWMKIMILK